MDALLLVETLRRRAELARHDTWSEQRLSRYRSQRLAELRRHAVSHSAYYARIHRGLETAPLDSLPIVTKRDLTEQFDLVRTSPRVPTHAQLERYLHALAEADGDPGSPWQGTWWAAATAGTTGQRAAFVWGRAEWASVLASYSRALQWADVRVGLRSRLRMAVVSSLNPTHQSAVVAASSHSPMVRSLRLDARAPLDDTVRRLNACQPDVLVGYSSALRPLAGAQLSGELAIRPRAVISSSEVLSDASAAVMQQAWGHAPYDVYAATETAGIASTCRLGRRHLYSDLVIAEPVDSAGDAVAVGTPGARLLVTVLFSRSLPLIRYEVSDRVTLSADHCPCGLPYTLVEAVGGRAEDSLRLGSAGDTGMIHVGAIQSVIESFPVAQWQVDDRGGVVEVAVVPDGRPVDALKLERELSAALSRLGRPAQVHVRPATAIPRTALGKSVPVHPRPHE